MHFVSLNWIPKEATQDGPSISELALHPEAILWWQVSAVCRSSYCGCRNWMMPVHIREWLDFSGLPTISWKVYDLDLCRSMRWYVEQSSCPDRMQMSSISSTCTLMIFMGSLAHSCTRKQMLKKTHSMNPSANLGVRTYCSKCVERLETLIPTQICVCQAHQVRLWTHKSAQI